MQDIVSGLLTSGKGILALDWSTKTITKQFAKINLISTPELNRLYRQMLVSTPNLSNYISGIILHEETLYQNLDNGMSFPDFIQSLGIIPGIRADKNNAKYSNNEEDITLGIEDLEKRLKDYKSKGVKFTKWRSGFKISDIYPSKDFVEDNLNLLSEFARISLDCGLTPIVEPEVEMSGNHTTTRCAQISSLVLENLFQKLLSKNIKFDQILLKTNMVLPGKDSGVRAEPLEIAEATLRTFEKSLPKDLKGVVFLSGGQTPDEATSNLKEIIKRNKTNYILSFSYARALQEEALTTWAGDDQNVASAQSKLIERLEKIKASFL